MGTLQVLCPKNERTVSGRPRCYTLSRERRCAASHVLQLRKRGWASPESFRVLKVLYERHIEGKHVPFQRYVITPDECEEIENDKQLPSHSRAFCGIRKIKKVARLDFLGLIPPQFEH